jgi:site-specific DNA-methyltransferase (adenine-specific)
MDLHGIENISQVLDPFFGIGSTAMAALDRNLTCLGFEIDKEYLTAAKKRIIEHLSAKNSAQPPK